MNEKREPIYLDDYEVTEKCRDQFDAVCLAKFRDADVIIPLVRTRKLNLLEWIVDFIVRPNIFDVGDYLSRGRVGCYLVKNNEKQYLVSVTNDFLTTRELAGKIHDKKFVIGKYRYKKAGYKLI